MLTRQEEAITELRYFRVSIVSRGLTEFAWTYNIVIQKEVVDQLSTDCKLAAWFRSWPIIPQPAATKSQLSDKSQQTGDTRENKLTERSRDGYRGKDAHKRVPIVDVVHPINLSERVISDGRSRRRMFGRKYYYHVRNHNSELEQHEPDDLLGGRWRADE